MRCVVFDDETLEAITVVDLPGLSDMALNERQVWRIAVHKPHGTSGFWPNEDEPVRFIDLKFERISRVTLTYGEQLTWMCLTRATDLAMLLLPDWLPGQRSAVCQLQEENERLNAMLERSLSQAGR